MPNLVRIVIIGLICWLYITLSSCSPRFTEAQARQLFGCKNDSIHSDTITKHVIDTVKEYVHIPADTVIVKGPCEEIKNMKPGEKKQKSSKTNRTTSEWGKDSTGTSFFNCFAQEYKDSMEWYRETWYTTVENTIFQSMPVREPTYWKKAYDYGRNALCIIGLFAIALLVIKFRSQDT